MRAGNVCVCAWSLLQASPQGSSCGWLCTNRSPPLVRSSSVSLSTRAAASRLTSVKVAALRRLPPSCRQDSAPQISTAASPARKSVLPAA